MLQVVCRVLPIRCESISSIDSCLDVSGYNHCVTACELKFGIWIEYKMFSFYFLPFISFTGLELEPVTATLSSTLGNNADFGAGKCIDGNTEGPDEGLSDGANADFCHTNDEPMPWIALDYGTTVNVQRVNIFNRRANNGQRTRNIYVRISNEIPTSASEIFSGGKLLGNFPGTASNGQQITISGHKLKVEIAEEYFQAKQCLADL